MAFLQYLDLSDNELHGNIPKSFRSMCQLKELRMHSNKLSGKLSDNIHQLCCAKDGLESLDLSDNPFERGSLPDVSSFSSLDTLSLRNTNVVSVLPKSYVHLSFLTNLDLSHNHLNGVDNFDGEFLSTVTTLDLSFNQLSGSMPLLEITKLSSLELLDLSHNQLNGPFPHKIGQLSNLNELLLSSNKLNGVINEMHLSNLYELTILDVTQNSLSFNLSSDWVAPFKLETLYAYSSTLGPKFPLWLKHQGGLMNLDISNSGISDSFPKWFWNLSSSLQYLNVSHNNLNGPLPKSFTSMQVKYESVWDFSFKNLNGSLPPFPELSALFLSRNMFTQSLSSFCASSSLVLTYLDLSSNLLEGQLSNCWKKFEMLQVLNLSKNKCSGKITSSIGSLRHIESIHLNNNNFSGEIPPLTLCSNLALIDVGDNNLQGILVIRIGMLSGPTALPLLILFNASRTSCS